MSDLSKWYSACDVCHVEQPIGVVSTDDDILKLCAEHARPYADEDFRCFAADHDEQHCPLKMQGRN